MTCRVCGCTEDNACINGLGQTCSWASPGMCSFCAEDLAHTIPAVVPASELCCPEYPECTCGLDEAGQPLEVRLYSEAEASRFLREGRRC